MAAFRRALLGRPFMSPILCLRCQVFTRGFHYDEGKDGVGRSTHWSRSSPDYLYRQSSGDGANGEPHMQREAEARPIARGSVVEILGWHQRNNHNTSAPNDGLAVMKLVAKG
ncbi:hypothetical protein KCP75_23975 [Salmonella enterica subsp. enterica]|nr:hypothetical protein KCP75_23975 [Salmonella enterica subsp. enterica]